MSGSYKDLTQPHQESVSIKHQHRQVVGTVVVVVMVVVVVVVLVVVVF